MSPSSKDKTNHLSYRGIYCIYCSCHTDYTLAKWAGPSKTHFTEHKCYIKSDLITNPVVAKYQHETNCNILLENISVLARGPFYTTRKCTGFIEMCKGLNYLQYLESLI